MSAPPPDPGLELDELLDPARLAAAWQRPPAPRDGEPRDGELRAVAPHDGAPPDTDPDQDFVAEPPAIDTAPAVVAAPLAVAVAHRQLLDELERDVLAAGSQARLVLAEPLAKLAAALQPAAAGAAFDLAGAEVLIDELEDVLQALLAAARWPASGED